ncbi:MAG: penicillin-binding protein 2 [Solirubrobacterales bacterium]|nr:penicillin-binding protein 2 [Solirubrobacterales bacterium]
MTPQLALRVAVVGSLALGMFAIIFFRLWFLQVLSGPQYLAQAQVNRTREIEVAAPRGEVLDQSGHVLVDSTQTLNVQISPPDLPVPPTPSTLRRPSASDAAVYDRLAGVLGMPTGRQRCKISGDGVARLSPIGCAVAQQQALLPYANVVVKQDVSKYVQYYLAERQGQFPGVSVTTAYKRRYPLNETAAQLFGTVGPITAQEVKKPRYRGVSENDIVGQSGLEYYYDRYLRGVDGADRVQVNSLGQFTRYLSAKAPVAGHDLRLSLDVGLQQAGQQALAQSIANNPPANGGAFVAMNPVNGEVYAMGSNPSFNPNIFTKPIPEAEYQALNNPASNFPLINRAIQSAGPTGSTFKPITATAALESGVWSTDETYDDTGQFCEGGGLCRHNAGGGANGVLDLVNAIRVSDDVFFYNLGALLNSQAPKGGALQHWASLYGIGRQTGIDLGAAVNGTLPSPQWRANRNALEAACERKRHVPSCGIADGRPWSQGDNVNLAVGQGDVQVTPLQLAVAYSAIANYGKVVRPHLGLDVEDPDGTVLQKIDPPPSRQIAVDPAYLDVIRAGLHAAAQSAGGTSDDVFGNFPEQVYGKTGTAQYDNQQDYSWYVCFVPPSATSKPIVVVVWVEQGGFGAVAAAPVAREILSDWFFGKPGAYTAGTSHTL